MRPIFLCLLASVALHATLIDFETLPGGLVANSGYTFGVEVSSGSVVTDQYWSTLGVTFGTGFSGTAVLNLGPGHAVSGTNGIGAINASGKADYSIALVITFYLPGTLVPTTYREVSIRGDNLPIPPGGTVTYQAFDEFGVLVANRSAPDSGGGLFGFFLADNLQIHRFEIWSSNPSDPGSGFPGAGSFGTVAFDNLEFSNPQDPVIPEPGSWLLMAGGVAGLVAAQRLRRRS